ncbi:alkaline phosphatase D family protein [Flavilitoribacter nigricans]|uniref:Twin-arginine translocation pathway signal protein n=1 Tax=Flavilitoribacter nigricans (strain ATCC 23147 / DSM 23189 / NBRC 102662 / NCIMB 1420 / SS-2) TaxID=1122177 RepID=A0A2D0NIP7_FLAN2|nr:alkaline phosphatase D family protein [Flavilitoribacter nigricans]PHN08236.1 twin-arginine translocation pathway signal protein [Flavilitoribacter nigricans DSM 23189 = NBRC 102662]
MKRRDYIKTFLLGSTLPLTTNFGFSRAVDHFFKGPLAVDFKSDWANWPDMKWAGPQYWGNRLQDWLIRDGKLVCDVVGNNRSLHLLTVQNPNGDATLDLSVKVDRLHDELEQYEAGCIGFRIGAKGPFDDYRSAAVFGKGLDVGLTPQGNLKIGEDEIETALSALPKSFQLHFSSRPADDSGQIVTLTVRNGNGALLAERGGIRVAAEDLKGNFALLSHVGGKRSSEEKPTVAFSDWTINSGSLYENKDNLFGPICFAQYTQNKGKLKLTAQLAPVEEIKGHEVELAFQRNGRWETAETAQVTHPGRAINFQLTDWNGSEAVPYRVRLKLPLQDSTHQYDYEGTIAAEPSDRDRVKAAVFSCNAQYGFPDADIYEGVSKLEPDVALFLGDQFYESTGGFGAQYDGDFDKTCLDYLRKWMMFGWSYREIYRNIPSAFIPDDHDVYHGNVWGEAGGKADITKGFGSAAQDTGGYKMRPEWVNMVQYTQTSHLPDAYDPTPVKQGIGVYYTHWNYGGVSFAILEDRKFKSAPKNVLPESAQVHNGWIQNDDFDIKQYRDIDADLLGERQEKFLADWVEDWSNGAMLKAVLSQTNFATVATLPAAAKDDSVVPGLDIPEVGEYVQGDQPTVDMDSNGWPMAKRDKAVRTIRKGFAFHIAGDQHLATFVQYGVDEHGDSGYAFAGPALNNLWPRRFWPPVDSSSHSYENPAYTGEHLDGFGNRITVKAVANPHNMHQEPAVLHNRSVGYGLVTFDKTNRTIKTDCIRRFKDPTQAGAQYPGWPVTIGQEDNYGRSAGAWLPKIQVSGSVLPVMKIYDEQRELVYALRLPSATYQPKVFKKGLYTVQLSVPETGFEQTFERVKAKKGKGGKKLRVEV